MPLNLSRRAVQRSANKENVKSWLESSSPTSVLNINHCDQQVRHGDIEPVPTPSPICSPSPSSPISSPRLSPLKPKPEALPPELINHLNHSENLTNQSNIDAQASSSQRDGGSTSKRHGKDIITEAAPDSPTGSSFSSGSEGGLLAFLASKLLFYREHSRGSSRYARERSGPIDDKHVMEDRGRKPPVEEISIVRDHPQTESMDRNGLHRTVSEATSELSLGSANGRTLSMEFDAMLAAAAATGIQQATNTPRSLEDTIYRSHNQQLPEIQEDHSLRNSSFAADQYDDPNFRALVRVGQDSRSETSDDDISRMTNALTTLREGGGIEDVDFSSILTEMPLSSRSSSNGSRRAESEENNNMQIVPTTLMRAQSPDAGNAINNNNNGPSHTDFSRGSNGESLAIVLVSDDHNSRPSPSSISTSSANSSIKDENIVPITNPAKQALEKVRREKVLAQATAYQDAKNSQYSNRYRREESKINAWENQQRIKASVNMKKVEMKLEEKRAKALEKMQNEIALAHKKAEQRKASAEAVRAARTAKVAEVAHNIRRTGKIPSGCLPF